MTSIRPVGVPWCAWAILCRGEVNLWNTLVPTLESGCEIRLLPSRSSGCSLEEASEDEGKADEEAEPYQTPSSEPPNEEIQNCNGSVIQQTVFPENGTFPITPHLDRQSSHDATNISTAVKHTRDEQVDHQSAIPNDGLSNSRRAH